MCVINLDIPLSAQQTHPPWGPEKAPPGAHQRRRNRTDTHLPLAGALLLGALGRVAALALVLVPTGARLRLVLRALACSRRARAVASAAARLLLARRRLGKRLLARLLARRATPRRLLVARGGALARRVLDVRLRLG